MMNLELMSPYSFLRYIEILFAMRKKHLPSCQWRLLWAINYLSRTHKTYREDSKIPRTHCRVSLIGEDKSKNKFTHKFANKMREEEKCVWCVYCSNSYWLHCEHACEHDRSRVGCVQFEYINHLVARCDTNGPDHLSCNTFLWANHQQIPSAALNLNR